MPKYKQKGHGGNKLLKPCSCGQPAIRGKCRDCVKKEMKKKYGNQIKGM